MRLFFGWLSVESEGVDDVRVCFQACVAYPLCEAGCIRQLPLLEGAAGFKPCLCSAHKQQHELYAGNTTVAALPSSQLQS